jgi:hypothetical protein
MWPIYEWQRVRKLIGGRWGHVTGFLWGKRWVRLSNESLDWDERWDIRQDCLRYRHSLYRIDEHGMLLRQDLGDPQETWYAIVQL